ncbi:MAG: hypothetical protein HZB38_06975, partial [Planctomycetes bacterium]|nr:hypothetical protein [Planctomycetota bacterium]
AIDPLSGDAYILTKQRDGRCDVFRLAAPWDGSKVSMLEAAGSLQFPAAAPIHTIVTAADFSPDGRELIVRSYTCGWLFSRTARESTPKLPASSPQRIVLAAEPQGEAVCFSADGRCLLTISEGSPTQLFECRRCGSDR